MAMKKKPLEKNMGVREDDRPRFRRFFYLHCSRCSPVVTPWQKNQEPAPFIKKRGRIPLAAIKGIFPPLKWAIKNIAGT